MIFSVLFHCRDPVCEDLFPPLEKVVFALFRSATLPIAAARARNDLAEARRLLDGRAYHDRQPRKTVERGPGVFVFNLPKEKVPDPQAEGGFLGQHIQQVHLTEDAPAALREIWVAFGPKGLNHGPNPVRPRDAFRIEEHKGNT